MLELFLGLYTIRVICCMLIILIFEKWDLKETFRITTPKQAVMFILLPFYIPYFFWKVIENKFKQEGV